MTDFVYSRHAETRMQQRGIREKEISLIIALGTQVDDQIWLMRRQDVVREIETLKRGIKVLERLANRKVVMRGDQVITSYYSRPADQKRTLRRGRSQGMA